MLVVFNLFSNISRNIQTPLKVQIETDPSRTVDFELLNSLHKSVDYAEFEAHCKKTVNVLIECGTVDPKRNTGFKYFEKATGVRIEHREQIDNLKGWLRKL